MNDMNRLEACRRDYLRRQQQRRRERAHLLRGLSYLVLGASVAFGLTPAIGWGWALAVGSFAASLLIASQD